MKMFHATTLYIRAFICHAEFVLSPKKGESLLSWVNINSVNCMAAEPFFRVDMRDKNKNVEGETKKRGNSHDTENTSLQRGTAAENNH